MSSGDRQVEGQSPAELAASAAFEPVRAALSRADEPERYHLLASLLLELEHQSRGRANGQGASAEQFKEATQKAQQSAKQVADLEDGLRTVRAELAHREKQLEAEQARARELQAIVNSQRSRLELIQKQVTEFETQLVARNSDLHRVEVEKDSLLLKLQRAELQSGDRRQIEGMEESKRQLGGEIEGLRAQLEQLRTDKNAEIDQLKTELQAVHGKTALGADTMLAALWQRMATAKPPLAKGHIQPQPQAGERLVDSFVELARFVHDFDKDMRVFLTKYTKHSPAVRKPWSVYAERDDLHQIIQEIVDPVAGKHVGVLRMKLKVCHKWAFAAMVASDSTIESIASELRAHLMGEFGAGSDPNCKVKDYLKKGGNDAFMEHMFKLLSDKLAEVFGYGG